MTWVADPEGITLAARLGGCGWTRPRCGYRREQPADGCPLAGRGGPRGRRRDHGGRRRRRDLLRPPAVRPKGCLLRRPDPPGRTTEAAVPPVSSLGAVLHIPFIPITGIFGTSWPRPINGDTMASSPRGRDSQNSRPEPNDPRQRGHGWRSGPSGYPGFTAGADRTRRRNYG